MRIPPSAATAEASENAKSFAAKISTPSAAAARSFVRTAIRRRPLRLRRTFETTHTARMAIASTKIPYLSGYTIESMLYPKILGLSTNVPLTPPV